MEYGMIRDESNEEYHANDCLSSSGLKQFIKEGAYSFYRRYVSRDCPQEEKDCFRLGNLAHCIVLERDKFAKNYKIKPAGLKKPTESQMKAIKSAKDKGKEPPEKSINAFISWNTFQEVNKDKEHVSFSDVKAALKWRHNIMQNRAARILLSNGEAEVVFRFKHFVSMQCKVDWWIDSVNQEQVDLLSTIGMNVEVGDPVAVDLKTINALSDWNRNDRGNHIYKFGYSISQCFYTVCINMVLQQMKRKKLSHFLFVVIEKNAPFDSVVTVLDEETASWSNQKVASGLAHLKQCYKSNDWEASKDSGITVSGIPENIIKYDE